MALYRSNLPQLSDRFFMTDGGIETTLIFHDRLSLPHFAAFDLLKTAEGAATLRRYFSTYAALANRLGVGCILESATWRASSDWGDKLAYSSDELRDVNREAIALLRGIRSEYETPTAPIVISGCIGPRGDGYSPAFLMTADEAQRYHTMQVEAFRDADADLVTAITMTYPAEAIGVVRAASEAGMPVVVSFTVETDGRLPTGQTLQEAIEFVDSATNRPPAYYMINCAHPTHFDQVLTTGESWVERIRGLRANASSKSHAELNDSSTLDDGDPAQFARQNHQLCTRHNTLTILGGCCGTDDRHIEAIFRALAGRPRLNK